MKKNRITGLLAALFVLGIPSGFAQVKVTVKNPSPFDRLEEAVVIPLSGLSSKIQLKNGETYVVEDAQGKSVISQVTSDRNLIFLTQLKSGEKAVYAISNGHEVKADSRAYGKYHPERKDDFCWENDKVGFRVYGKSLIAVDGPSNGIDLWFKRTNRLVVDEWYEKDRKLGTSFHIDHGEGMDAFAVGRSLGAGAMAPFVNDTLWLNKNYETYQLLDNGPLRVRLRVTYNALNVAGKSYKESREFVLDAGSNFTKVIQAYEGADKNMKVAAGILKHENDSTIATPHYLIYKEPTDPSFKDIYVAVIFPFNKINKVVNTYTTDVKGTAKTFSHTLAVTNYSQPSVYFTGFGWSKSTFPTVADFHRYVELFKIQAQHPLKVTVK
ncbi:MAG: DUF4861 family protein [Dysgonamonadaceae bacterium]